MKLKWAIPQAQVKVLPLHPLVDDLTLSEAFSQFGHVESAVVATDPITKRSKGYAYVTFSTRGCSKKAIEQCKSGYFLVGPTWRPVRVEAAQFDELEEGLKESPSSSSFESKPRFAQPGSAEYDFAVKWSELEKTHKKEEEEYKERHSNETIQMLKMQEDAMTAERAEVERRRVEALQQASLQAANFYPPYYNNNAPPSPSLPPHMYPPPHNNINNFNPPPNYPPTGYPPPMNGYQNVPPGPLYPPQHSAGGPIRRHINRENPYNNPLNNSYPPIPPHSSHPPHSPHLSHPSHHPSNNPHHPSNNNNPLYPPYPPNPPSHSPYPPPSYPPHPSSSPHHPSSSSHHSHPLHSSPPSIPSFPPRSGPPGFHGRGGTAMRNNRQ